MPGVEFHPIQLDSLVVDTVLDFELHSKTASEAFVLFRGRDQEFGSRHRDGLLSHGIHTLYVSDEDSAVRAVRECWASGTSSVASNR